MKKLFGFINTSPKIWFHYLPLVGVVFLAHWTSMKLGVEALTITKPILGWTILVAWYYVFLLVFDNFIHLVIGED